MGNYCVWLTVPLTFYNYKLGTVRMWWVRVKHCTVAGRKSIPAPEIGYLTRKDIARYKRADMKYYFYEVYFFNLIASVVQNTDQLALQRNHNSLLISWDYVKCMNYKLYISSWDTLLSLGISIPFKIGVGCKSELINPYTVAYLISQP